MDILKKIYDEKLSSDDAIDLIDDAILQGVQIKFDYNKYGADKKMHHSASHVVSPYQMILHNGRYYLMGYNEKWQHIQYILKLAVTSGNIEFECHGLENIPKENGFLLYGNHQCVFPQLA